MIGENGQSDLPIPAKNFFRIGEVSRLTATKAFVLRYWESEFPMLQPVKSPKGHRLYRRQDIDTVLAIKRLLYDEGFTIAGARRHLREQNGAGEAGTNAENGRAPEPESLAAINRKTLLDLRDALQAFLTLLEGE
ncbi:MAG: MerR family transcriptional regulator [Candidatus Acidiferrales bacterium]